MSEIKLSKRERQCLNDMATGRSSFGYSRMPKTAQALTEKGLAERIPGTRRFGDFYEATDAGRALLKEMGDV